MYLPYFEVTKTYANCELSIWTVRSLMCQPTLGTQKYAVLGTPHSSTWSQNNSAA